MASSIAAGLRYEYAAFGGRLAAMQREPAVIALAGTAFGVLVSSAYWFWRDAA